MKILEIRPEQVICIQGGQVCTKPNSPFYTLKFFDYKNRQVGYIFSDKSYVRETYDDRIFNCWHDGQRVQLRQDLAERLALAIKSHKETGSMEVYNDLITFALEEIPNEDILTTYLKNLEGVERDFEGNFIILDRFKIDTNGNAWVKWEEGETTKYRTKPTKMHWASLCIVMQGYRHSAEGSRIPDGAGTFIKVNGLTMTILTKVMFLLSPDLEDTVFMGQLSEELQIMLKEREEVKNRSN